MQAHPPAPADDGAPSPIKNNGGGGVDKPAPPLNQTSPPLLVNAPPQQPTPSPKSGSGSVHHDAPPAPSLKRGNDATPPSPSSTTARGNARKKAKVKESVIDHTYRDFSQVKVSSEDGGADDDKGKNRPNFPSKLHGIVSNPNYQHIICWLPHGRSWKIVDKYLLTSVIIPQHFSHAKFESFNRSVNGWGFKRLLNAGPDCKSYYHECFLRGRPELTVLMQRLVNPGKRLPDKAGEPDFYQISKDFPLPPALPPVPPSLPPSLPPSGKPRDHAQVSPRSGLPSPKARRPAQAQPVPFTSPPHMNSYGMYGYPQAAPYPPMPSPGGADHGSNPHQQPQQMYWPNQSAGPSPYQPTPSPYGYYPYPPQMMMMGPQAGPQGYFINAAQPYPQPGMHNPYFPPTPQANGSASVATSEAASDPANNYGEPGQYMKASGLAAVAEVASVSGSQGELDDAKTDDQTRSNAELTTEV